MGRRYTAATYLRRLGAARGLQPDDGRDRRLPAEDERAFRGGAARSGRSRRDEGASFLTRRGRARRRPPRTPFPRRRRSAAPPSSAPTRTRRACAGGGRRSAPRTSCSSTGQGGYGDDYSPWLLDGVVPVGELVRARASGVTEEASSVSSDCLFCRLYARASTFGRQTASSPSRTSIRVRRRTSSSFPSDMETFRDVASFPTMRRSGCRVRGRDRARGRARGLPRRRQRRPGGGQTIFHLHLHIALAARCEACPDEPHRTHRG